MFGKSEKVTVHLGGLDGIIYMRTFNTIEYLAQRDYLVRLEARDYGFQAIFPEQCLAQQKSPVIRVEIHVDFNNELIHTIGMADGQPQFRNMHEVPAYAVGEFIMSYLTSVCGEIEYDRQLIVYSIDGKTHVSKEELFECTLGDKLSEEQIEKGIKLIQILGAANQAGYPKEYKAYAEEQGVLCGYNVLLQLLGEANEETQNFMVG